MNENFKKLELLLLYGYDLGIPLEITDPWQIIDPSDDVVSSGASLEEALENLDLPKFQVEVETTFGELWVGDRFKFENEIYRKISRQNSRHEDEGFEWMFRADSSVIKL